MVEIQTDLLWGAVQIAPHQGEVELHIAPQLQVGAGQVHCTSSYNKTEHKLLLCPSLCLHQVPPTYLYTLPTL